MAGDDNSTKWSLDLDISDAVDKANEFQDALEKIGDVESFSSLLPTIAQFGVALGAIALAVAAFKETLDLTEEGEQINAINNQFNTLTSSLGLNAEELKRGMEEAAGGLVSETDLLKAANQAMIGLGSSTEQLPELMTVARQATQVFGGSLMENFHNITQAVESGNVRMLKHYGIIVDQQKAYKDYANSIGLASNELSKSGQQQAILDAVLDQAKTSYAGINGDVLKTTNALTAFKTALVEIKETAAIAIEKVAGPTLTKFFTGLKEMATDAKTYIQANFGSGVESAAAKTKILEQSLLQLKGKLADLEVFDNQGFIDKLFGVPKQLQIANVKKQIADTEAQIKQLSKTIEDGQNKEKAGISALTASKKEAQGNQDQINKDNLKYQEQLLKMQQQNLADDRKNASSIVDISRIEAQQVELIEQEKALKLKQINEQYAHDEVKRKALEVQLERETEKKIRDIQSQGRDDELKDLQQVADKNKYEIKGFVDGWKAGSKSASNDFVNFSKTAKTAQSALSQNMVAGFEAMGDGSKSAGQAMKDAMIGALADIAIAKGSELLLMGLWPFNPAEIAAGGALIALGGYLKSQVSGAQSTVSTFSAGGAGGASFGGVTNVQGSNNAAVAAPSSLQQAPQKTVNLTIQGNYYDSNETRLALMDIIRQSTDATDFNYFKVGGQ